MQENYFDPRENVFSVGKSSFPAGTSTLSSGKTTFPARTSVLPRWKSRFPPRKGAFPAWTCWIVDWDPSLSAGMGVPLAPKVARGGPPLNWKPNSGGPPLPLEPPSYQLSKLSQFRGRNLPALWSTGVWKPDRKRDWQKAGLLGRPTTPAGATFRPPSISAEGSGRHSFFG